MNADEMIDFALGQLEVLQRQDIEKIVRTDVEDTALVERLGQVIHRLLDDGHSYEPPPGLAQRTLSLVAQSRTRARSILDSVPVQIPYRWADLAVAAGIFIAGILTLLPALQRSRERMSQAGCVFNLQQLGNSLAQYASVHPFYPYPASRPADTHAGMFAVLLHDSGVLHDLTLLDCPYNGPCPNRSQDLPNFEQVDQIRRTDPERYRRMLCWDYAFHVGYRDGLGRPRPLESRPQMHVPVVADQPPHDNFLCILEGNSPNHAHRGQNTLFSDGSVRCLRTRHVSPHDSDLYLNNEHKAEPGVNVQDAVLMPSKIPFGGLPSR
jgi:hypothetical protein